MMILTYKPNEDKEYFLKVKIIEGRDTKELEEKVNKWLKENIKKFFFKKFFLRCCKVGGKEKYTMVIVYEPFKG